MIVWGSWEALDKKSKPNKCKQCNFSVEGKLKPSKVKQKLEAHYNRNHQVSYSEESLFIESDLNSFDQEKDKESEEEEDIVYQHVNSITDSDLNSLRNEILGFAQLCYA